MSIRPFKLQLDKAQIDDLRARLERTRWPEATTVDDWTQGTPLQYVREVCDYWANEYDMARLQQRLNAWPQHLTEIDGLDIHFLHVRSPRSDAQPLIVTHGWPGSVVEFLKVIGPLSNPESAHQPAFHLVIPSLPGYGFSAKPEATGWSVEKIADAWAKLMHKLGYPRYFAQGGDWGGAITTAIGTRDAAHCAGLHTNMPIVRPTGAMLEDLSAMERDALAGRAFYQRWDSGYSKQQSTRPQSVGYGLVDSPAALAGWILEKYYQWTDCDGHPENVLTRDELLDNLMMYWLPATGASSARLYWESFGKGEYKDVTVPSGVSIFPKEIFRSSERWVRSRYTDLHFYREHEHGGHFAAFERPDTFVEDIRDWHTAIN
jgi:epoxide hydrolase